MNGVEKSKENSAASLSSFGYCMMRGEDSDVDYNSDDNSMFSTSGLQARRNSYSRSNRTGIKSHVADIQEKGSLLAPRFGKQVDDSSTCCSTSCTEESSSTFLEGSISSLRCTYKACTDVEDRILGKDICLHNLTGSQGGNNSATTGLESMDNSQQQRLRPHDRIVRRRIRLQKRSRTTAIQLLSMSIKCLPRELEMKKLEEENTLTKCTTSSVRSIISLSRTGY